MLLIYCNFVPHNNSLDAVFAASQWISTFWSFEIRFVGRSFCVRHNESRLAGMFSFATSSSHRRLDLSSTLTLYGIVIIFMLHHIDAITCKRRPTSFSLPLTFSRLFGRIRVYISSPVVSCIFVSGRRATGGSDRAFNIYSQSMAYRPFCVDDGSADEMGKRQHRARERKISMY